MSSEDRYYVINGTLIHADQYDEMYHAGVVGMQWGKHLPGTDWWKDKASSAVKSVKNKISNTQFGRAYNNYMNRWTYISKPGIDGNTGKTIPGGKKVGPSRLEGATAVAKNMVRAKYASAKASAKQFGKNISNRANYVAYKVKKGTSKLWNSGKGYTKDQINKFQSSAKKAYSKVRNAIIDYFNKSGAQPTGSKKMTSNTPLSEAMNKQRRDAVAVYQKAMEDGGIMNTINLAIQTSQFNISKGVNQFLKQIGMDDEVNAFMKKFGAKKKK